MAVWVGVGRVPTAILRLWITSGNWKGQGLHEDSRDHRDAEMEGYTTAAQAPEAVQGSLSSWMTGRLAFRETSRESIFKTDPMAAAADVGRKRDKLARVCSSPVELPGPDQSSVGG